ncbi:MAG: flagellar protein FliT [Halothiobacillaceae bacterium]
MAISCELLKIIEDEAKPIEHIESLVAEREERIRRFFSSPIEPGLQSEVAAWIQELMSMDREAMDVLAQRRQKLQEQYTIMRRQMRGVVEYQQTDDIKG